MLLLLVLCNIAIYSFHFTHCMGVASIEAEEAAVSSSFLNNDGHVLDPRTRRVQCAFDLMTEAERP